MKLNVLQKFILLFSICVVSFSCSDDNNDNSIKEELSLENLVLSESQLNTIGTKISGLQQRGTQSRFSQEQMNNEMEIILQPMVDNGREIYNEIINNVDLQNSEYELNNEDIASIQNLDDKQLAQLSYIASLAYSSEIIVH